MGTCLPRSRRQGLVRHASLWVSLSLASTVHAGGVVGTGSPASCTEAAFAAALVGGGAVTFNCGPEPVTVPITHPHEIAIATTIGGAGLVTLDAGGSSTRILLVRYRSALTVSGVTFRNARVSDSGAAIRTESESTLTIRDSAFFDNWCTGAGADIGGGAFYALGTTVTVERTTFSRNRGGNGGAIGNLQSRLTIDDSVFVGNQTNADTTGSAGNGGAIYVDGVNGGQMVVRRSRFAANVAANLGGAIHTYLYQGGTGLTIEDSTFRDNMSVRNGGAIFHMNGLLTITGSTFEGNTTVGQGGALWIRDSNPTLIRNSTFTENTATGRSANGTTGLGGAILLNANNQTTLDHVTVVGNHADWVGGGICGGTASDTLLRHSIVAHNTAANGGNPWNIQPNCASTLGDGGQNLQYPPVNPNDGNDRRCAAGVVIADPLLLPLASNGGPTQTIALSSASPALEGAVGCPGPATDQRGLRRPQGAACEVGAYEAGRLVHAWRTSDLDGDGRSDVLWRHDGGATYWWKMSGTALAGAGYLPSADPSWTIQGTGDFDGDGKDDLLWRDASSGATYVWLMNGSAVAGQGFTSGFADDSWTIQGVGDFDGDGRDDILWRHTNGTLYVWLMHGLGLAPGSSPLPAISLSWQVRGIGDLNGDGRADVLWRETTSGATYAWFMNGTTAFASGHTSAQATSSWSIEGVGDLDGDGKDDILWRHTDGGLYVWLMDGLSLRPGSATLPPIAQAWRVEALGDYDGDGKADLLWREMASGSTFLWLMDGPTVKAAAFTSGQAGRTWTVQRP